MKMCTKKRVLLIDDDSRYLELVEMMLEGDLFEVLSESRGELLFECATRFQPDVIIMDIILHHRNGIELAHDLRCKSGNSRVPIIFVSAWTGNGETKVPRNSMRLFKPFTQSDLISTIHAVLGVTNCTGVSNE